MFAQRMNDILFNSVAQTIMNAVVQPLISTTVAQGTISVSSAATAGVTTEEAALNAGNAIENGGISAYNLLADGSKERVKISAEKIEELKTNIKNTISTWTEIMKDPAVKAALDSVTETMNFAGKELYSGTEYTRGLIDTNQNYIDSLKDVKDNTDDAAQAVAEAMERMRDLAKGLNDWLNEKLLGEDSVLPWIDKFTKAQQDYQAVLKSAQSGDEEALNNLTKSADVYLQLAKEGYAGSQDYGMIFQQVTGNVSDILHAFPKEVTAGLNMEDPISQVSRQIGLADRTIDRMLADPLDLTGLLNKPSDSSLIRDPVALEHRTVSSDDVKAMKDEIRQLREDLLKSEEERAQRELLTQEILRTMDKNNEARVDRQIQANDTTARRTEGNKVSSTRR
jgi:hypothetical protein